MTDRDDEKFWSNQTSSRHRGADPEFYSRKAAEHAALMTPAERKSTCLDLGCGAGELIEHLRHHVNLVAGLDYSASMLNAAKERLGENSIKFIHADLFDYLPEATEATWLTTGAVNQYLDLEDTARFLRLFKDNPYASSLFLFDCVDPLRYAVLPFGPSYLPTRKVDRGVWKNSFYSSYWLARRVHVGIKLALGQFGRAHAKIGRRGMGYGYFPNQWRNLVEPLGLSFDVVSSALYEYRFHVIVRKPRDV